MSDAASRSPPASCRCSTAPCLWSRKEKGFAEAEGVELVAGARNLLGQYPRPPRRRPFRRRAYAGADADRLQSRPDAARRADHRADGARARRQCGDGLERVCGRRCRSMAPRRSRSGIRRRRAAGRNRRARQAGKEPLRFARRASAFRAQLRASLLACGLRHRSRSRHRDRHRAAAADGRRARRRPHRRLLRRRALEHRGGGQAGRQDRDRQGGDLEIQPGKGARRRRAVGAKPIRRRWPRCCGRSTARRHGARRPANHGELAHCLPSRAISTARQSGCMPALDGRDRHAGGDDVVAVADFFVPHAKAATFPWKSHALWFYTQMVRWGQVEASAANEAIARDTYRPDLYRAALKPLGVALPGRQCKGRRRAEDRDAGRFGRRQPGARTGRLLRRRGLRSGPGRRLHRQPDRRAPHLG